MRVIIVDADLRAGRRAAEQVQNVLSTADVLLYDDATAGVSGIVEHRPDVVLVAPRVGALDGPEFVKQACGITDKPRYVGIVDVPDPDWSTRYVAAGVKLVVSRPLSAYDVRVALRHVAGGIPS
jgi:DNA-binding NarL/FixJ family response regulator